MRNRISTDERVNRVSANAEEAAYRLDIKDFVIRHQWCEQVARRMCHVSSSILRITWCLALGASMVTLLMYTQ